jgi:hypothetical protein
MADLSSPARPRAALLAHRGLRSGLAVRAGLSLAGAVVLLACGIWMARIAIVDHVFPPYVAGVKDTVITSYSGPLLAGAVGVGAVAGLLLVVTVTDLWRRRLIGPDLRTSAALPGEGDGAQE